jgi:hypothetical protein
MQRYVEQQQCCHPRDEIKVEVTPVMSRPLPKAQPSAAATTRRQDVSQNESRRRDRQQVQQGRRIDDKIEGTSSHRMPSFVNARPGLRLHASQAQGRQDYIDRLFDRETFHVEDEVVARGFSGLDAEVIEDEPGPLALQFLNLLFGGDG